MKGIYWLIVSCVLLGCSNRNAPQEINEIPPSFIIGDFQDDYDIRYTINETVWLQHPSSKYNIIEWVPEGQYLIAQNDTSNLGDGGLFTRIDWVELDGMPPYAWAFCLSAYNAKSAEDAARVNIANRDMPKTGCNGFPFSRMQAIVSTDTTYSGE